MKKLNHLLKDIKMSFFGMHEVKVLFLSVMVIIFALAVGNSFSVMCAEASENHPPRVVDAADLLTDSEESELLAQVDEISERQQVDVAVVTVNSLEGEDIQDYTADYYDYNGYGIGEDHDGIMLLISMEEREWFILTTGYGINILSDADLEMLEGEIVPYLSEGDYAGAFRIFAESCDGEITYASEEDIEEAKPSILISIVIGLLLGLIPTFVMRGKLKTVHMQKSAGRYEDRGSRNLTTKQDIFLYHTVNRVPKPKDDGGGSSTFKGSSGTSHGGRGGSF